MKVSLDVEKAYHHPDTDSTVHVKGTLWIDADTKEQALAIAEAGMIDRSLQTLDPRIKWEGYSSDRMAKMGYVYIDFSFQLVGECRERTHPDLD